MSWFVLIKRKKLLQSLNNLPLLHCKSTVKFCYIIPSIKEVSRLNLPFLVLHANHKRRVKSKRNT